MKWVYIVIGGILIIIIFGRYNYVRNIIKPIAPTDLRIIHGGTQQEEKSHD